MYRRGGIDGIDDIGDDGEIGFESVCVCGGKKERKKERKSEIEKGAII